MACKFFFRADVFIHTSSTVGELKCAQFSFIIMFSQYFGIFVKYIGYFLRKSSLDRGF